jgi:DNA-binding PadR family transcriptional regulator
LRIRQGSLYPALHRLELERRGLIKAHWGTSENNRRAKYYELSKSGRQQLEVEKDAWAKLTAAGPRCWERLRRCGMLSDLIFRLRSLFRRNAVESELDEELRFHLEQQVEKHVRSGQLPIEKDDSLYLCAIVLETDRPMNDMEHLARTTLAGINPNPTVEQFQNFDQQISDRFTEERLISRLSTLFGTLALLLASVGLYGVTAYSAAQRTPEIGIRMALGAERGGVIAMVMRGAIIQTAAGLAIGVPVAVLCVRFVKAQL